MCQNGCGLFGECLNGVCQCSEGFSQSLEFRYDLDADLFLNDTNLFATLPCDSSDIMFRIFYGMSASLALLNFLFPFLSVKKLSHVKRLMPFFAMSILSVILQFYRTFNLSERAVFSVDPFLDLMYAFGFFFSNVSVVVFVNKYIASEERILKMNNEKRTVSLYKFEVLLVVLSVLMLLFLFLAAVIDDVKARFALMRIGFFCYGLFSIVFVPLAVLPLSKLEKSVRNLYKKNHLLTKADNDKLTFNLRVMIGYIVGHYSFLAIIFTGTLFVKNLIFAWKWLMLVILISCSVIGMIIQVTSYDATHRARVQKRRRDTRTLSSQVFTPLETES